MKFVDSAFGAKLISAEKEVYKKYKNY